MGLTELAVRILLSFLTLFIMARLIRRKEITQFRQEFRWKGSFRKSL